MHPNAALITRFYEAFQRKDGAAMAACYHRDASFSDPAFSGLTGEQPGAMWKMLCERGKDLQVTFSNVQADDSSGSAHWEATYTFSQSGRRVHNVIDAAFTFKDGLILSHRDVFDFHRWAGQALGLPGKLLGWLPPFQAKVGRTAKDGLAKYMARTPR